ncbi:MAG: RelA/SpoT domain-containing protein [Gemmataceae bacterium]
MPIIDEFLGRYRREYDFYDQAARLVAQKLDAGMQSAGIRGIVTSRAKSPARLEGKIQQRDLKKNYQSVDDVYADIVDLAGARVALYFPGERDQVDRIIVNTFDLTEEVVTFPKSPGEHPNPVYTKRFAGYFASHYRVKLRPNSLSEANLRYADARIEIQVASVLMHAWSEVEHDLIYKPMQGALSVDEYAILDELNGLVIAGEISLERLQRAGEARVAINGREFTNHFELAAFLLNRTGEVIRDPRSDSGLGRVDLLFDFLKELGKNKPDEVAPYLKSLSPDTEKRPLSEQIVDQLLAEDANRYPMYESLAASRIRPAGTEAASGDTNSQRHAAIGEFFMLWGQVESMTQELIFRRTGSRRIHVSPRAILEMGLIDPDVYSKLQEARVVRNRLLHEGDTSRFTMEDVSIVMRRLQEVLPALRGALGDLPSPSVNQ